MNTCTESSENVAYMVLNLGAEIGELQGKVAKAIRKNIAGFKHNELVPITDDANKMFSDIRSELGDVLWQVAGLAYVFGWDLEDVAQRNLSKLADRQERGVIVGEGDNR